MRPTFFPIPASLAGFVVAVAAWVGGTWVPAFAETVEDKPRLVITVPDGPGNFGATLRAKLGEMRRFQLVERRTLKAQLAAARITLGGHLSVQDSIRARDLAKADLLLDGTLQQDGGSFRITTRFYDFRTGEFSRDLSLIGDVSSAPALAGQLASFVRHSAPLRCLIKDLEDDVVVLDLGAMDGVTVGTLFRVLRYPANVKPRELGTIRVSSVLPFVARAEAEDVVKGVTLEPGDVLLEKTTDLLLK